MPFCWECPTCQAQCSSPMDRRLHIQAGCGPSPSRSNASEVSPSMPRPLAASPAESNQAPKPTKRPKAKAVDKRLSKLFTPEMIERAFEGLDTEMELCDTVVVSMSGKALEDAISLMEKAKDIGNTLARAHEWAMAERCYTDAIGVRATEAQEELRGTILSNRAQMRLKLKRYKAATEDATEAIARLKGVTSDDVVFKAYLRKVRALRSRKKYKTALKACAEAKLRPGGSASWIELLNQERQIHQLYRPDMKGGKRAARVAQEIAEARIAAGLDKDPTQEQPKKNKKKIPKKKVTLGDEFVNGDWANAQPATQGIPRQPEQFNQAKSIGRDPETSKAGFMDGEECCHPSPYIWDQGMTEMYVKAYLPPRTAAKRVKCEFDLKSFHCTVQGTTFELTGTLWRTARKSECMWSLADDGELFITLAKADERMWPSVFDDEQGVDALTAIKQVVQEDSSHVNYDDMSYESKRLVQMQKELNEARASEDHGLVHELEEDMSRMTFSWYD